MAYLADDTSNRKFAINQKPQDTSDGKKSENFASMNEWIIARCCSFHLLGFFNTKSLRRQTNVVANKKKN